MNEDSRVLLEFRFPDGSTWEGDGRIVLQDGDLRLERRVSGDDYWHGHPSENAAEAAGIVFREMLNKIRSRDAKIFKMANEWWVND